MLWAIVWLAVGAELGPARAQEDSLASAVKATYLYKFAPFIEWPTSTAEFPDGSFTICVVGNAALGAMLDRAVHGQEIAGHPIVVHQYSNVTGNPGCAVMYAASANGQAEAVLAAVHGTPVLTVTDYTAGPAAGPAAGPTAGPAARSHWRSLGRRFRRRRPAGRRSPCQGHHQLRHGRRACALRDR